MVETIKNLMKAFIGESQARNRYTFYAKVAKKEGYEQISEIFEITAENEKEHAKWSLRLINQLAEKNDVDVSKLKVEADVPNTFGTTKENLKSAIEGESYETKEMYPQFADVAEKEGYPEVAKRLRSIAAAEKHHMERFSSLLKEIEEGTILKKDKEVYWMCRKCGYLHYGKEPPEKCPSCDHESNYFEVKCEEY